MVYCYCFFIFRIKSYCFETYILQKQISNATARHIRLDLKHWRYMQWVTTCMYIIHRVPVVYRSSPAWVPPRCAYSHGLACYCANSHPITWAHMRTFSSHHIRGNARTRIASHARKCAHMRAFASNARKCGHSHRINKLSHKQSNYQWFDTS